MSNQSGVIAAGHERTAEAAAIILRAGGNAFDAALAALCASCVAEPVLASLGGGGFLLAKPAQDDAVVYDFFAQTPQQMAPAHEIDFFPIVADFGDAQQEFHIGKGSIATPGVIKGMFRIHHELCRLPLQTIIEPACWFARRGIQVNSLQNLISRIVEPILRASSEALAIHQSNPVSPGLAQEGEIVINPQIADSLESLLREGDSLFYEGEMGRRLVRDCEQQGGQLRADDLAAYAVEKRPPLNLRYRDALLLTNPTPSLGGTLIAFTLSLLRDCSFRPADFGSIRHLRLLARAMRLTQQLRSDSGLQRSSTEDEMERLLGAEVVDDYRKAMRRHSLCSRGTTQISVADANGNLASLTVSNGEGSGYVLPGTGIMLNNMLGEADINPAGFHRWHLNRRIASMMAPTMLFDGGGNRYATGSGGSNRIRSAILQVLMNLIDFQMRSEAAVVSPRIHYEDGLLNLEPERNTRLLKKLATEFPGLKHWSEPNLFFGGAHTVMRDAKGRLSGAGDPRRGGCCKIVVR